MEQITDEVIRDVLKLARIDFEQDELPALKDYMQKAVLLVDHLFDFDVSDISLDEEEISEDFNSFLREDVVSQSMSTEVFLNNSPSHVGGMIKVNRVIGSGEDNNA